MKTIVKGAILALLAVALVGAAEARNIDNNTNGTFIIGETNVTFTLFGGLGGANYDQANNDYHACASGTLGGISQTSTQGVGNISTGTVLDTNGKGLVAGPYNFYCSGGNNTGGWPAGPGAQRSWQVTAVIPTYAVVIRSAVAGKYASEITTVASGDNITINTTNNLNDYLTPTTTSPAQNTVPTGGVACTVDLIMRQQGNTANKLASKNRGYTEQTAGFLGVVNNVPYSWTNNTTDIGSIAADVNRNFSTQLVLTPTTDYPSGTYQFSIAPTSAANCNGISAESAVLKTLAVTTAGITWKADKTTAGINDIVTFTGTTSPYKNVSIELTSGTATQVQLVTVDADSFKAHSTAAGFPSLSTVSDINAALLFPANVGVGLNRSQNPWSTLNVTSNSAGTFTVQAKFTKDGTYELQATGLNANIENGADNGIQPQKVSITISAVTATLKTDKTTAFLGQDVTISGTVTAGQSVVISINDKAETIATVQADKTYSYLWTATRTRSYSAGAVKIAAWVCPQTIEDGSIAGGKAAIAGSPCVSGLTVASTAGTTGTDTKDGICEKGTGSTGATAGAAAAMTTGCDTSAKKSADASWSINMQDQTVTVTSPASGQGIAEDDQMVISGTAPGATGNNVFAWAFNSKGTTSGGTCYAVKIGTTSADQGYTWTKTVGKSEITDDPGDYTLVVQSMGRDGHYSDNTQTTVDSGTEDQNPVQTEAKNLNCNDDTSITGSTFNNKQGSQILSILQDNALNKAGSDDQGVFKVIQFKVVSPSIKLNACASTVKGSNLNVSGTSNRIDGTTAIVSSTGPKTLAPKTVTVANGTFSATFTAAEIGADVGTYTVTADDLKGKTDTVTCSVIVGSQCALSVAVKSSKTQVEKDEKAALTATVSNSGDEACTSTTLSSTVTPSAGATVTWAATSVTVPAKGSVDAMGNFSASADGSYTVAVTATRGAATANGSVNLGVGKAMAATPAPTGAATPAPTGAAATPAATPKPSPGFEAVFAIAGLLAVAYLVNRRKR